MKWYNEDNTACLDLEKVSFWVRKSEQLDVYIGSTEPLSFYGSEAQEIYKMLTYKKEIL